MAPYLLALLIVVASLVLGGAVCRGCSADTTLVPAVGLSTLIALAALFVRFPGHATTAAIVLGLATLAAAVWLIRDGIALGQAALGWALSGLGAAAVSALPFLAAGSVGIPGMSLNNDTAVHILWADGLRDTTTQHLYASNPGYPLGPHSLLAALAEGTGQGVDSALIGLLIATMVLFAVTAAGVLRDVPVVLRVPGAIFASATYLAAAWFAQGAFKEPLMALLLLGFGVGVGAVLTPGTKLRAASLVPLGLIAATSLLTYSYLAAAWLGVAGALACVLTLLVRRPKASAVRGWLRDAVVPLAVGGAVGLAAVAIEIPRLWNYVRSVGASPAGGDGGIGSTELGNLAGPLPAQEALGIWPTGDFRFPAPPDAFMLSELKLLALVCVIGAVVSLLARRRDIGLLAALGSAVGIWALSDRGQSPYVTAKALVILSPFVALVIVRALLPERFPARPAWRAVYALRVAAAAILIVAGLWSSGLVLRGSPVESPAQRDQLATLQPLVKQGPTLFLGDDDYAGERLHDMPLGYIGVGFPAPIAVPSRQSKPYQPGNALDWDSVDPATLDRFRYVVTSRSPYASAAPDNFRLLRSTPLYQAWERTGPTAPRSITESGDAPAATFECEKDPATLRLSRRDGVAAVLPGAPVLVAGPLPPLWTGTSTTVPVTLPAGTWNLAMKYTSPMPMRLQIGATRVAGLPANTTRNGTWWPAGTVHSDGSPQNMFVIAERVSRFSDNAFPASTSGIMAVPAGAEKLVPLSKACGRVVDWYRTR